MNNQYDNAVNKTSNVYTLSVLKNRSSNFDFFYKKSERLCTAIFLLSESFPKGDVLKDNLRNTGVDLMMNSLSLISANKDINFVFNEMTRGALQISALSRVASGLNIMSLSNFEILDGEIGKFLKMIEKETESENIIMSQVLTDVDDGVLNVESGTISEKVSDAHGVSGMQEIVLEEVSFDTLSKGGDERQKDISENLNVDVSLREINIKSNLNKVGKTEGVKSFIAPSVIQKSDRQKAILDIIKKTGETSIKDITTGVEGCSEKTIQRELNSLIYDGVLKKVGERRWSKYMFV